MNTDGKKGCTESKVEFNSAPSTVYMARDMTKPDRTGHSKPNYATDQMISTGSMQSQRGIQTNFPACS